MRFVISSSLIILYFILILGQTSSFATADFPYAPEIQALQKESFQKIDQLIKDKNFQEIIADLKTQESCSAQTCPAENLYRSEPSFSKKDNPRNLYIFVSFSLGEKALLNLAQEAKAYRGTLVLRGFKENSYVKTAQALQNIITQTRQGFIIDPELFSVFSVTAVPTYVLSQPFQFHASERTFTPLHDRLQGHVSVQFALEAFAKEGDLKNEAQVLLKEGPIP